MRPYHAFAKLIFISVLGFSGVKARAELSAKIDEFKNKFLKLSSVAPTNRHRKVQGPPARRENAPYDR